MRSHLVPPGGRPGASIGPGGRSGMNPPPSPTKGPLQKLPAHASTNYSGTPLTMTEGQCVKFPVSLHFQSMFEPSPDYQYIQQYLPCKSRDILLLPLQVTNEFDNFMTTALKQYHVLPDQYKQTSEWYLKARKDTEAADSLSNYLRKTRGDTSITVTTTDKSQWVPMVLLRQLRWIDALKIFSHPCDFKKVPQFYLANGSDNLLGDIQTHIGNTVPSDVEYILSVPLVRDVRPIVSMQLSQILWMHGGWRSPRDENMLDKLEKCVNMFHASLMTLWMGGNPGEDPPSDEEVLLRRMLRMQDMDGMPVEGMVPGSVQMVREVKATESINQPGFVMPEKERIEMPIRVKNKMAVVKTVEKQDGSAEQVRQLPQSVQKQQRPQQMKIHANSEGSGEGLERIQRSPVEKVMKKVQQEVTYEPEDESVDDTISYEHDAPHSPFERATNPTPNSRLGKISTLSPLLVGAFSDSEDGNSDDSSLSSNTPTEEHPPNRPLSDIAEESEPGGNSPPATLEPVLSFRGQELMTPQPRSGMKARGIGYYEELSAYRQAQETNDEDDTWEGASAHDELRRYIKEGVVPPEKLVEDNLAAWMKGENPKQISPSNYSPQSALDSQGPQAQGEAKKNSSSASEDTYSDLFLGKF